MVNGQLFHFRKHSWPADDYVSRSTLQLLDFDGGAPPEQAWRRRLNSHANLLKEFSVTFMEAIRMIRLGVRLWSYVREEASHGRKAPIDPFTREKCRPSASLGVPLGGMGSGSISRGFRGEFKHWQIIPNSCEPSAIMTNQFSIFINREGGQKKYSSVLAPGQHEGLGKTQEDDFSSWDWNLGGQHSTYHALFPRAWTVYDGEPDPELKISCRQISPFIPHDYRESSLPAAVFVYTLVNTGKERAKVSLLFTWANSIGGASHLSGKHTNEPFREADGVSGVLLHHRTAQDNPPVTFAIAACETQNVSVSVLPSFGLSKGSYVTARDMWATMLQKGHFDQENFSAGPTMPSSPGETLCAAVSASAWVEPHGKCTVAFSLAWASPKVKFKKGCVYNRRYTKFYGTSENSASTLAHDALMNYKWWEEEIEKWQNPVLKDDRLPDWYKFTLFNELYFLVAGGTLWTDGESPEKKSNAGTKPRKSKGVVDQGGTWSFEKEDVGRFLYLEGVEYVMWCTYDVHFYASFALLALFPKIELGIQRDFARAVLCEDRRKVKFLADGAAGIRKVSGAVPHDLGLHDPWHEMNAYNIHDTSRWKDLNPKFVLQVYRDVAATGDEAFARQVWPAVRAAMDYMDRFDRDGDGLIENDGFPDQTYDAWTAKGVSAYSGGLWLAALQAAAGLARRLGHAEPADRWSASLRRAVPAFEAKLWNGSYFSYDAGSRSIQADQLAGQWYTAAAGLPPLFDEAKIHSALHKVFEFNVMKVNGGRMGAVNGMTPAGKVDETCMQSREIWTGVTYAVAAGMIHAGMTRQGFATAEGVFTAGWSEDGFGYWFQTPEAWTVDGHYRSLVYMRPLAIWAMQWALSPGRAAGSGSAAPVAAPPAPPPARRSKCFDRSVFRCDC
ncbi:beta-glucosidase, GBA2 type family protein isoform X2 [Wolffia australiana]